MTIHDRESWILQCRLPLGNDRTWSQEAFADLANLHRTYVGHVNIERFAATLGVSLAELFAPFTDKPAPPS